MECEEKALWYDKGAAVNIMDDDYCYECTGYGDNYYEDKEGNLVCRCPGCLMNPDEEE